MKKIFSPLNYDSGSVLIIGVVFLTITLFLAYITLNHVQSEYVYYSEKVHEYEAN